VRVEIFSAWPAWLQALVAGLVTWGLTALGASVVFMVRAVNRKVLDALLGFAAGVMLAASVWSLLIPSMAIAAAQGVPSWMPAVVGLFLGGMALYLADAVIPHLHLGAKTSQSEGLPTPWKRSTLLFLAMTLHNIPEGLSFGVAFGAGSMQGEFAEVATYAGAIALVVGIGLQNIPEGMAIALPMRGEGMSRLKAWGYGAMSAVVEPIFAVLGALAVVSISAALPYALSFAAGAMLYVVIEELIPESQRHGNTDLATLATLFGFALMMVLDVALS